MLLDGHDEMTDGAVHARRCRQAKGNMESNAEEGQAEMAGADAVFGWAGQLHWPAVPASAEEPVEGTCCLPVVFSFQIYLSAFKCWSNGAWPLLLCV
jgi:hypothetical protein